MKDKLFIFGLTLESVNVFGPFQKVGGKEGGIWREICIKTLPLPNDLSIERIYQK